MLPKNLYRLDCRFNNLTLLPQLPKNLYCLDCRFNNLIELPDLPKIIFELDCFGNKIPNIGNFNINNNEESLVELNDHLELYIKHHNALIKFQRIVRHLIWRRHASLKERCRRVIIINDVCYDNKYYVPQEVYEYIDSHIRDNKLFISI
jgi:Leucine-rich repeat (LRR) protein